MGVDTYVGIMNNLTQKLIAAKALIDTPEKWGCGGLNSNPDAKGCCCIQLACSEIAKGNDFEESCMLKALGFSSSREAWHWNDAPERTHAEVMDRFDGAIATARQQP